MINWDAVGAVAEMVGAAGVMMGPSRGSGDLGQGGEEPVVLGLGPHRDADAVPRERAGHHTTTLQAEVELVGPLTGRQVDEVGLGRWQLPAGRLQVLDQAGALGQELIDLGLNLVEEDENP